MNRAERKDKMKNKPELNGVGLDAIVIAKDQIKKLLEFCIERGEACSESCNSHHINAVINQMRGAIWFVTGDDPGSEFDDLKDIADILGIKYQVVGNEIKFDGYPEL